MRQMVMVTHCKICYPDNVEQKLFMLILGTPCNKEKSSDVEDWTPFSSVSTTVDESVFDRSCVSLMEDLSQSTISTPIRDLRHQMVSTLFLSTQCKKLQECLICKRRLPKFECGVWPYKI